jgi:hypothetical protein
MKSRCELDGRDAVDYDTAPQPENLFSDLLFPS